jgi:adenylate cyclase
MQEQFDERKDFALATAAGLLAFVLLARIARRSLRVRRGTYRVDHAGGHTLVVHSGQSLLEAIREARIPHASVCGGRARCTTCRVRVGRGAGTLPAPNAAEMLALQRIHAEPNVRLACQLRPQSDLQITPLLPANAGAEGADQAANSGRERTIAVMFVDLRDSSRLAEHRLPFDVLFILNRFFAEMADALHETGGYYSTFNGDGFMALYGTTSDLAQGCRDALHGAIEVSARLAQINTALASELREPLRVGISVHAGEAIVGTMGPPAQPIVSALGDTVNVASRLEGETKSHRCALVVSAACAKAAGIDLSAFPEHTVQVRGRAQSVSYYAIADAAALAPLLPHASVASA